MFATGSDRKLAKTIDDGIDRLEIGLAQQLAFTDDLVDVTARYLLEAGGKRVRPLLTLLIAQLGDGITEDVLTAAEAIEITHLGSLYHDDVMDDADKRRGVPSAHQVFGNNTAILTGDLLFARASQLMADLGERAIRIQAATFERLVLGQLHETTGPRPGQDEVEHYLQVLADKTGSLIAAAAQSGVIFSNAPAEYERAVVEFGEKVGIAFQLIDDVIDLSPQPEETGKVPGTDLRAGVVTLPMLYLRREAATDAEAAALVARIDAEVAEPEHDPVRFAALVATLRDHAVTARTFAEAKQWSREAVAALAALPDGSVKKSLVHFAEAIVDRRS
ncbi:polyprenyl synthetase family protein [Plantibacter flavus]